MGGDKENRCGGWCGRNHAEAIAKADEPRPTSLGLRPIFLAWREEAKPLGFPDRQLGSARIRNPRAMKMGSITHEWPIRGLCQRQGIHHCGAL